METAWTGIFPYKIIKYIYFLAISATNTLRLFKIWKCALEFTPIQGLDFIKENSSPCSLHSHSTSPRSLGPLWDTLILPGTVNSSTLREIPRPQIHPLFFPLNQTLNPHTHPNTLATLPHWIPLSILKPTIYRSS